MHRLAKLGYHPVLHLLRLAQHQAGTDRVLHRADAGRGHASISAPNLWPNTPGHPDRIPAVWRAARRSCRGWCWRRRSAPSYGIYGPAYELLEHVAARPRQRGVPGLGEIPDSPLGSRPAGQPARLHRPR
ncbi:MAG: hypothetical protein MZV65_44620 [Chromatiales bacterium]|nr:hypothetical protein [Chromatiales bacterium]